MQMNRILMCPQDYVTMLDMQACSVVGGWLFNSRKKPVQLWRGRRAIYTSSWCSFKWKDK